MRSSLHSRPLVSQWIGPELWNEAGSGGRGAPHKDRRSRKLSSGCPASPRLCAAEARRQACLARRATRMCGASDRPLGPARPRSACGAPSRALSGLMRAAFGCPPELMGPLSRLDVRSPAEPPRAEAALPSGLLPPARRGGFLVCFWLRAAPQYTAEAGSRCCERRPRTGSPTRCWNFNKSLPPIRLLASCCGFQSLGAGSHRG